MTPVHLRPLAWLTVNRQDFVDYKIAMRVAETPKPAPVSAPIVIRPWVDPGGSRVGATA